MSDQTLNSTSLPLSSTSSMNLPENAPQQVRAYLLGLQDRLCTFLEDVDGVARCVTDPIEGANGSLSQPKVLSDGAHIEQAAVQFTHSIGDQLPTAASTARPHIAGWAFQAVSLSWIFHPRNPYVPTTHGNLRFFNATQGEEAVWWFGGGFDLTPYYGFKEDAIHWHQQTKSAVDPFGAETYSRLKSRCDEYFYLPHRQEGRGVGGLFYDDWSQGGFESSFEMQRRIGDHFLPAYSQIFSRRSSMPYGEREREFQLYRRGRYVEFNLLYDRGTKYGIQSGRRVEAVMASMPPVVHWRYQRQTQPHTPEAQLTEFFLKPQDWCNMSVDRV